MPRLHLSTLKRVRLIGEVRLWATLTGDVIDGVINRTVPTVVEAEPVAVPQVQVNSPTPPAPAATPPPTASTPTPKSVHFNVPETTTSLAAGVTTSQPREQPTSSHQHHHDPADTSPERFRHHRRRHSDTANDYRQDRRRDRKGREKRTDSPDSTGSGETVDLPARFDERGRRIPEDQQEAFTMQIDDFMNGRNTAGRLFRGLADDLFTGSSSSPRRRR